MMHYQNAPEFESERVHLVRYLGAPATVLWTEESISAAFEREAKARETELARLQAAMEKRLALAEKKKDIADPAPSAKRAKTERYDMRDHLRTAALYVMHKSQHLRENFLAFTVSVQKALWNIELLYLAGHPTASHALFSATPIRRKYGPAYESAQDLMNKFERADALPEFDSSLLDDTVRKLADEVLSATEHLSWKELSYYSAHEKPWKEATEDRLLPFQAIREWAASSRVVQAIKNGTPLDHISEDKLLQEFPDDGATR
eukprot:m.262642 g.262642  ORF g.262642 m.262642 type:complete len:261 (-) comp25655_c0_seq1:218-1000(-)